jgi:low temperature requirement protein LtrA
MGYVVMRLAMVAQWLRAARAHADCRRCALRYAVGIAALQLGWVARLAIPDDLTIESFLVLAAAELCVPLWAEAAGRTSWHPRHIAERYGLFTIIVLGESVLAATVGVQAALDADSSVGDLATLVVGGLLVMFAMWWIYFDLPTEELVDGVRRSFFGRLSGVFAWGYGHYFVFASAAAVGAGLAVGIDHATGHSELSDVEAGLALTVPVAVFLVVVWLLHIRHLRAMPVRLYGTPATAALVAAASALPEPILATGILLSALIAIDAIADRRRDPPVPP